MTKKINNVRNTNSQKIKGAVTTGQRAANIEIVFTRKLSKIQKNKVVRVNKLKNNTQVTLQH